MQQRYVVVVMMFLSMTFTFLLRMSFPIVLTQMVYIPNINSSSSINATTESNNELICPVKNHMLNNTTIDPDPLVSFSVIYSIRIKEQFAQFYCSLLFHLTFQTDKHERFQWSQKLQGIILSSFYWGNILSEIPSSILVQRIGPKTILLISITLSAIVTVLTPLAVAYGIAFTRIT